VNGEFGSENAEGGNGSHGYGRCIGKSEFIYCFYYYYFKIRIA